MATLKQRLHKKNSSGSYDTVHLETSASLVLLSDGTTVEDALNNSSGGVIQYTVNIPHSGWSTTTDSNGYYYQTVTVPGLKANYSVSPDVDIELTGTNIDTDAAMLEAFSHINIFDTGNNSLTARCISETPGIDVTVKVRVFG